MSGPRLAMTVAAATLLLAALLPSAWLVGLGPADADSVTRAHLEQGAAIFRGLLAVHGVLLAGLVSLAARTERRPTLWRPAEAQRALTSGERGALWALLVAALVLRIIGLGGDIWIDELSTLLHFVRPPFSEVAGTYTTDNQHVLYSHLAKLTVALFGESAVALRLPAVGFGVLSLWLTLRLGRLVTDNREALIATALLTFSYHHIWFSQNARGYTGLLAGTILATELLLRALASGRMRHWLGYAATVAATGWVHLTMGFVVVAHILVVAVLVLRSSERRDAWLAPCAGFTVAGTLTLQLYALILPQVVAYFTTPKEPAAAAVAVEWKNPLWLVNETLRGLGLGLALGWLGLIAAGILFGAGIVSYLRRDPTATALFILPGAIGGATLLALGRNLWPRFFFNEAAFALLFAIRGAFVLGAFAATLVGRRASSRPAWGTAFALLLVAASAASVPRCYRHPKQDFTGARDFVLSAREARDRVVGLDLAGRVYQTYYAPDWAWAQSAVELSELRATDGATWVLYTLPRYLAVHDPEMMTLVERDFELVRVFPGTLGDGAIIVRRAPPPPGTDG